MRLTALGLVTHLGSVYAQSPATELEVVVELARPVVDSEHGLHFSITLRNTGERPVLLRGGALLGNGRQAYTSLVCLLDPPTGNVIPLQLHWQVRELSKPIYPLSVPLRPGDSHTVAVTPNDYKVDWPSPGKYELRCRFLGQPSKPGESPPMPEFWRGVSNSEAVSVEISANK